MSAFNDSSGFVDSALSRFAGATSLKGKYQVHPHDDAKSLEGLTTWDDPTILEYAGLNVGPLLRNYAKNRNGFEVPDPSAEDHFCLGHDVNSPVTIRAAFADRSKNVWKVPSYLSHANEAAFERAQFERGVYPGNQLGFAFRTWRDPGFEDTQSGVIPYVEFMYALIAVMLKRALAAGLVLPPFKLPADKVYAYTWAPCFSSLPSAQVASHALAMAHSGDELKSIVADLSSPSLAEACATGRRIQAASHRPLPIVSGNMWRFKIESVVSGLTPRVRQLAFPPRPYSVKGTPVRALSSWLLKDVFPVLMLVFSDRTYWECVDEASDAAGIERPSTSDKMIPINQAFWELGGVFSHHSKEDIAEKVSLMSDRGRAVDVEKFDNRGTSEALSGIRAIRTKYMRLVCPTVPDPAYHLLHELRPCIGPDFHSSERLVLGAKSQVVLSGIDDTSQLAKELVANGNVRSLHQDFGMHPGVYWTQSRHKSLNAGDDGVEDVTPEISLDKFCQSRARLSNLPAEVDENDMIFLQYVINRKAKRVASLIPMRVWPRVYTKDFGKPGPGNFAVVLTGMLSVAKDLDPSIRERCFDEQLAFARGFTAGWERPAWRASLEVTNYSEARAWEESVGGKGELAIEVRSLGQRGIRFAQELARFGEDRPFVADQAMTLLAEKLAEFMQKYKGYGTQRFTYLSDSNGIRFVSKNDLVPNKSTARQMAIDAQHAAIQISRK